MTTVLDFSLALELPDSLLHAVADCANSISKVRGYLDDLGGASAVNSAVYGVKYGVERMKICAARLHT